MRMFVHLSRFVPTSLQEAGKGSVYLHDTLTDTDLIKKPTTLGKKEYTLTLCKDVKYSTERTRQMNVTHGHNHSWSKPVRSVQS